MFRVFWAHNLFKYGFLIEKRFFRNSRKIYLFNSIQFQYSHLQEHLATTNKIIDRGHRQCCHLASNTSSQIPPSISNNSAATQHQTPQVKFCYLYLILPLKFNSIYKIITNKKNQSTSYKI